MKSFRSLYGRDSGPGTVRSKNSDKKNRFAVLRKRRRSHKLESLEQRVLLASDVISSDADSSRFEPIRAR